MVMFHNEMQRGRVIASIAATAISLASGTNYVYSAWAPQFAERLKLSSTESNLIGLFGNLGMYSLGFLIGYLVDTKGPRPAVLLGAIGMALGYFPLHQAYDAGSGSIGLLCLYSYLSGVGGCTAFAGAVKTSALNWPNNRGTATAFPLAAFGLSAFFFSLFGSLLFPGDPSAFLMLLSCGTSGIALIGFFFLKVYPETPSYQAVSAVDLGGAEHRESTYMERNHDDEDHAARKSSGPARRHDGTFEPGTSTATTITTTSTISSSESSHPSRNFCVTAAANAIPPSEEVLSDDDESLSAGQLVAAADNVPAVSLSHETTPLLENHHHHHHHHHRSHSRVEPCPDASSSSCAPIHQTSHSRSRSRHSRGSKSSVDKVRFYHTDIRGWTLLKNQGFWLLWITMAILAGIGIMTINNIGNDAKALWEAWDPTKDQSFLVNRQQMHVSTLSLLSFTGRLLSGIGSDFLVKRLHLCRSWCLVASSVLFITAQVLALVIRNPNLLILVSAISGLAYGSLFGGFPSIIAETFGITGFSQNWGFITMAPVVSGNVFTLWYGMTYDSNSIVGDGGERICRKGLDCYKSAYLLTLGAAFMGLAVALYNIRWQHQQVAREKTKGEEQD